MKRFIVLTSMLLLLLTLCSCGKNDEETSTTATETTVTQAENRASSVAKSDFESVVGNDVDIPEEAENENYYVIQKDSEKFGQVTFRSDKSDYVLRVEDSTEFIDISGCYYEWNSTEKCEVNGFTAEVHLYETETDNCSVIIWFDSENNKMYSLSTDSAVTKDALVKLASEI